MTGKLLGIPLAKYKTETELASFISGSLIDIANLADSAEESDEKYQEVIEEVRKTRDTFRETNLLKTKLK